MRFILSLELRDQEVLLTSLKESTHFKLQMLDAKKAKGDLKTFVRTSELTFLKLNLVFTCLDHVVNMELESPD